MSPLPRTLTPDDLLLTVNNRLAVELHREYDRLAAAAGQRAWATPRILPWRAWLQSQYQLLLDAGHCEADLLTPLQERSLWRAIIASDGECTPLLQVGAAARSAQEAYARLLDWELDANPLAHSLADYGGSDTARFLAWRARLEFDLARDGLMVAAQLTPLLRRAFADGTLACPARLLLAGFETLSPAQRNLLDALGACGCDVVAGGDHDGPTAALSRSVASDPEDEILHAAHWARDHLARSGDARIGIVCTQLQQRRDAIERVFTRVLAPNAYLAGRPGARPFNLSLGEPLARRTLSAHALLTLRLLHGQVDLDDVGRLLRSPFVGGAGSEWEARALFDTVLRRDGRPRLDLGLLRRQLRRAVADTPFHCPDLLRRLDELSARVGDWSRRAGAAAWADRLQDALRCAGWPGDRALDSHEHQAFEKTGEAFRQLAGMDKLGRHLDLGDAIA